MCKWPAVLLLTCAGTACGVPSGQQEADPVSQGEPADLLTQLMSKPGFTWANTQTENFRLHYLPGSTAARHAEILGEAAETALSYNLALLGEASSSGSKEIELFFVRSRDEMGSLVGNRFGGIAFLDEQIAGFVLDERGSAAIQHELMHLLAHRLWGKPKAPWHWIHEGLGTYAPGSCDGYGFHALSAAMLDEGLLPSLDGLVKHFHEYDDLYAYLASASFIQHMHETWGIEAIRSIWRGGLEAAAAHVGASPTTIEADWHAVLASSDRAAATAMDEIIANGCESNRGSRVLRIPLAAD